MIRRVDGGECTGAAQTAVMVSRAFDDDHRGGRGVPAAWTAGIGTA